ncbi:MAG: hypothetical protein D3919_10550 [Candidatus Electrothrix sp. AW5]|nr:hypothetical protein [Candidatus Electrothrix gigas]
MARKPQRSVEAAIIENIGPVSIQELLAMPEDRWGMLRDRITDQHNGKDGLSARCMLCDHPVYIKTSKIENIKYPLFAHYAGSNPEKCPWYHGRNIKPDDARAAQYKGQQESRFHRLMCERIAEIVALDKRYIRHKIDEYLPPTNNSYGRYPDVYVEWDEIGTFAVEFQMSNTFQTEISARCKHYEYEGIPLLWILFGIDTIGTVQQSFCDVIRRHRGNAFVLDDAAITASREQQTLVLSCFLDNENGLDQPKLVRFDELKIPTSKLPYYEDRIVPPILKEIEQRRQPWFDALEKWEDRFQPLRELEDRSASTLVAAAFSIVAHANGKKTNYVNRQNLTGMLNGQLNEGQHKKGVISQYATLLTRLIENTAQYKLLETTVGDHIKRATATQVDESSQEWKLLKKLLPEALDPVIREELIYYDALPDWAKNSKNMR